MIREEIYFILIIMHQQMELTIRYIGLAIPTSYSIIFIITQPSMGLFYSWVSYFKSFYSSPLPNFALSETKITLSANKLIHTLRYKQMQIQKEAKNLQSNLIVAIDAPKGTRSLAGEHELMEAIVRKSELVAAYEEIIRCANAIKNEARMLELDSTKVSEVCVLAICTIMYAYKDLELSECINLSDFVPEPHPLINKKQISPALREYVEYEGATQFAINTYILEMCSRNHITLEKVNEVGHNFTYSPSKLVERESKSSAMFALSMEEIPFPFQEETNMDFKMKEKKQEEMDKQTN